VAAKHSAYVFGTARFLLSFGTAILVLLVVWVAVRAVGPAEASKAPLVALPSIPRATPTPTKTIKTSRSPSRTPSKSPTPSKTSARASDPVPKKTRTPTRTTTTAPPARTDYKATLSVTASWQSGYMAVVRVVNEGDEPVRWKVTVSHSGQHDLQLRNTWNARGELSGSSLVFTGGTLAPGRTASFGFQTSKSGRGDARPADCNALGGTCRVR